MLVTETTPFPGSRVRFPVKALRFFSEIFSEKSTLDTGCFKADFCPEFPFSGIPGFPLPYRRKPGRMRSSGSGEEVVRCR